MERDSVDAMIEQWRHERPELDVSPIGVMGASPSSARARDAARARLPRAGLEHGWHDMLATLVNRGPPYRLRATEPTRT